MTFEPKLVVSASEILGEHRDPAPVDPASIARGVDLILRGIGEDPSRPGLVETPRRVAESLSDLVAGYAIDPVSVLEPLTDERGSGLIMMRAIPIASLCEHHLLPFTGTAAVAYEPGDDGRITGLSKLARLMDVLSRRLQVQERLVREAADALEEALAPRGVFVLIEAEHTCVSLRGARKPGSVTVTTEARGIFAGDAAARAELAALARG
ncbi:MAG TPA: GTP cyclohydrolase I [Actinomycetota bacterium]|nr:GTP cyclohydrolase I [Actinomycetota bacterium]